MRPERKRGLGATVSRTAGLLIGQTNRCGSRHRMERGGNVTEANIRNFQVPLSWLGFARRYNQVSILLAGVLGIHRLGEATRPWSSPRHPGVSDGLLPGYGPGRLLDGPVE